MDHSAQAVADVVAQIGVMAFAMTGALVAVQKAFDIVGVVVLAVVTAVGGGSVRDLLLHEGPAPILLEETILWIAIATGLLVFLTHRWIPAGTLYALDTVSLAVFAALGAAAGINAELGVLGTAVVGTVSGVGGGVIRDVLAREVPGILYRSGDFYASAASAGALAVYGLHGFGSEIALLAGVGTSIAVRLGSRLAGLHLPVARS